VKFDPRKFDHRRVGGASACAIRLAQCLSKMRDAQAAAQKIEIDDEPPASLIAELESLADSFSKIIKSFAVTEVGAADSSPSQPALPENASAS
jgi:hypothetical protein